jgi:hypothetical protein
MLFYKNLLYGSMYNLGFLGGWRCFPNSIDGHYDFITDLKEFVIWQFGDYATLTTIKEKYSEPALTDIEQGFCNDAILSHIRRAMFNNLNPNCTDIADPMWDNVYGDDRVKIIEMWGKLKKYPFSKSNVSLNIVQGDYVTDGKEVFKADHNCDISYINKCEKYKLVEGKRYDFFPAIPLMGEPGINKWTDKVTDLFDEATDKFG